MIALLFVAQLVTLPNQLLTPGAVRPLTLETICTTKWGTDRRFVSEAMKKHIAAAYGIPWEKRALYEFDHLVPRSLGGADDILNIYLQPLAEAHVKDALEIRLSKLTCAGKVPLKEAQEAIRRDWQAADKKYPRATK